MKRKDVSQVKWGAVLSYVLIAVNAVYGLFLTPYIVGQLGSAEYGVYKTIASFSSSLMVLDFGLGGTVMRYLARYRARKEDEKIPGFVFMSITQALILALILFGVSVVIFFNLNSIFSDGLTSSEIVKAKSLFIVLVINMGLHMFENVINGIISGYNRFVFGNSLKLLRLCLRIFLVVAILAIIRDSMVLVLIDLFITCLFIIVEIIFVLKKLHVKISIQKWDMGVFLESTKYTLWMFLSSIAAQVNNNLDNTVIGAIQGSTFVTIYSMALLIFSMFENLSTSISGVLLPTVTNLVNSDCGIEKIQKFIIKVGKIQFEILGAVFTGFLVLGQQFIDIWLGSGYSDVYYIAIILMFPAIFELCVNACLAVLRAKNMLAFRTVVLTAFTILNGIVTIFGVKMFDSYFAAAFGTALSFAVGSVLIMNLYYKFKLGYNMLNIYKSIIGKTWICLIISGAIIYLTGFILQGGIITFVLKGVMFLCIYFVTLYIIQCTESERKMIKKYLRLNNRRQEK